MPDPSLSATDRIRELEARKLDERARSFKFGPAPVNPFEALRLEADLTYVELAKISHIDVMAIKRAEWGTYAQALPSLSKFWAQRVQVVTGQRQVTEYDLLNEYDDYVYQQRRRHRLYFGASLEVDPLSKDHPFRQLRSRRPSLATNSSLPVGLVEVSRAMCVPLDTIQFFEKKLTQKSVPKIIKLALNQMGYTTFQITVFETNYELWRNNDFNRERVRFK